MQELILNETPVRTSRNFNINNAKLKDINIPENIGIFNNVKMTKNVYNNINKNYNLTYGLSNCFKNQVIENANQNLRMNMNKENCEAEVVFTFDNQNLNLVDDIEIVAEENSHSTVIIKYKMGEDIKKPNMEENKYSNKSIQAYHNGIIRVLAKENSSIHVIIVNLMNTMSNNFLAIENSFENNSKINYTIVDFGGRNSITNYYSNLVGEASENKINTIYFGKENQFFDLNYIGELRGEKTNINIEVQGVLDDMAKKNFKGTIDFKKGCKKAVGNENEFCMLLSDNAKSIALPMLLCSEENIDGNHSSATGKADNKELFYIMSRGFELKEAMKLLVRARFNGILNNIENEELKDEILNELDKRFERRK